MFGSLALASKSIDEYRAVPGVDVDHLRSLADPLKDVRVLNLSVTSAGTSVADLLTSSVPLLHDLGLECYWQTARSYDDPGLESGIYNAIAGAPTWTLDLDEHWRRYNAMNAELYEGSWDFVVVHDPQPAGILEALRRRNGHDKARWIWHCHLDLNSAPEALRMLLRARCEAYDAIVFDLPQYQIPEIGGTRVRNIRPAIDPLDAHNAEVSEQTIARVLSSLGVDASEPLVVQVAPLDRWHDGIGLLGSVRRVRESIPNLQLVLVANITRDDPETRTYFQQVSAQVRPGEPVYIISTLRELGYVGINVFQRAADVIALRNVRKGLSMRLLDAMWKAKPVVTRPGEAMREVVKDGETGWLADSEEQWVTALAEALNNVPEATRRGLNASSFVGDNFLVTRYLDDYLKLFGELR
jgi:trehalose synthase